MRGETKPLFPLKNLHVQKRKPRLRSRPRTSPAKSYCAKNKVEAFDLGRSEPGQLLGDGQRLLKYRPFGSFRPELLDCRPRPRRGADEIQIDLSPLRVDSAVPQDSNKLPDRPNRFVLLQRNFCVTLDLHPNPFHAFACRRTYTREIIPHAAAPLTREAFSGVPAKRRKLGRDREGIRVRVRYARAMQRARTPGALRQGGL